jgi:hypothetical protein
VLVASSDKARRELGLEAHSRAAGRDRGIGEEVEERYALARVPLPAGFAGAFFAAGHRLCAKLLGKPLDAPFGVHQLLPSREERMAVRADFQVQLFLGGSGLPGRTAGAPGPLPRGNSDECLPSRQNPPSGNVDYITQ